MYAGGVLSQPIATVEAGMGRKPNTVERLSTTTKTEAEVQQFLRSISHEWTAQNYDLWEHNCNNFSERVAQFLVGSSIPTLDPGLSPRNAPPDRTDARADARHVAGRPQRAIGHVGLRGSIYPSYADAGGVSAPVSAAWP